MNFIIFLLILTMVEVVFRIVGIPYKVNYVPNENSFSRFDPELGWSYIPNVSTLLKAGNIEKPVYFDINGIRAPYTSFQFDSSQPTILFIGGSFTMGHGLSYEESFVGRFDALKRVPYQVVNVGVQGYGSDQALIALKKYFPRFNVKAVVYTFIEDHLVRNSNYDRRMLNPSARFLGTKPQFALNSRNELYLARMPLLYRNYVNSYLIDFLKIRIGAIMGSFPPFSETLTKGIIEEMKKYSNEHGALFVILNWRWSSNDYERLFRDLDIDVIDTISNAPEGWEEMVLLGGIHPNAEAGDHAAGLLFDYFNEKDLL